MDLTPTRKGRFHDERNWKSQYDRKKLPIQDIVQLIRDGDNIACSGGGTWPKLFDAALAQQVLRTQSHVTVQTLYMLETPKILSLECKDHILFRSAFYGVERNLVQQGNVEFVPIHLGATSDYHRLRKPRVVVMAVSPPDENGWMSRSIWGTHLHRDVFEDPACEILIAEVNHQLPYLCSDGDRHIMVHVSEVDYIAEGDYPWPETKSIETTDVERQIAAYAAELIPNGACLQLGFGGLANAIGEQLLHSNCRDLGLQTEVLTNCIARLMQAGILNNSHKAVCAGRSVASAVVGDRTLWDFCNHNPDICMKEIDWVNHPANIAKNDRVISINGVMEIDLTGQAAAEAIGPRQYTGTGGQLQWVIGSQWSKEGKSILALTSTYRDKKSGELRSKIKPTFSPGTVITTPRTSVQYVITEYGVADLRYRSTRERAKLLASIAHPDFRGELLKFAEEMI